jgi:hypothetical protein
MVTATFGTSTGQKNWPQLVRNLLGLGRPTDNVMSVAVPSTTASGDATTLIGVLPEEAWIDATYYLPTTTMTAAAGTTNYRLLQTYVQPVAGTTSTIASLPVINSLSLPAGTPWATSLVEYVAGQPTNDNRLQYRSGATNPANNPTMAGVIAPGSSLVFWKSLHVGATGLADPGGTAYVRYNTKFRNCAIGGALIAQSGVYHGGWATHFAFRPRSQSYGGAYNYAYAGQPGEINLTASVAAGAGPFTVACDPLTSAIAAGTVYYFSTGSGTGYTTATVGAAFAGSSTVTLTTVGAAIAAGSQGYAQGSVSGSAGYETLVSNGLSLLNWGINDAGGAIAGSGNNFYDINAVTETYRACIANASCAYMSSAIQGNITYAAGNGSGAVWASHSQPVSGQFWNPMSYTSSFYAPTGSVKLFSGAVGATAPTITIQIPHAFEGGTIDLFFLALAGANNGGAASILVDGANPPNGTCTINTNNASTVANVFSITGTVTNASTTLTSSGLSDPSSLGLFLTGTNVPALTYITALNNEPATPGTAPTTATMSAAATGSPGSQVLKGLGFVPMVKRLTGLARGSHTITITLTSMGAGLTPGFFFYGYGIEPSNVLAPDLSAPVGVMNVPTITNTALYVNGTATNVNAVAINTAINAILAGTATSSQSGNSTEPSLNSQSFLVNLYSAFQCTIPTALSATTTTLTFTCPNTFIAGQQVYVQGCTTTQYNGQWTVATASSTQFTVTGSFTAGTGTVGNGSIVPSQNFSNDGLHPSSRGNAVIAQTILNAMTSNSGITPVNLGMTSG